METIVQKETIITKDGGLRKLPFDTERLVKYMEAQGVDDKDIAHKVIRAITAKEAFPASEIPSLLIRTVLEEMDEASPHWTFVASRIYATVLYKKAGVNRRSSKETKYGDFAELVETLVTKGIYHPDLLSKYSKEELEKAGKLIDPERDKLLTYPAIRTLSTRYLATGKDESVYELPQERWLVIALWLMQDEDKSKRLEYVEQAYWALSNLLMTVATPTLANSGKLHGQLSSCFIDTVEDSLQSIYDSNTDIATLSKWGGGIGVYVGKIRARGSSIRGHKGASSGTVPWIKQLNNTAVSVDQLGEMYAPI